MLDMAKTEAGYQAPRIQTRSAEVLEGAKLAVAAAFQDPEEPDVIWLPGATAPLSPAHQARVDAARHTR